MQRFAIPLAALSMLSLAACNSSAQADAPAASSQGAAATTAVADANAAASAAIPAATPAPSPTIPEAFRGNWYEPDGDRAPACGNDGDALMTVDAASFSYPMSNNDVTAVESRGDNAIHLSFRFQSGAEGAGPAQTARESWTLNADKTQLAIAADNGRPINGMTRLFRCAAAVGQ